VESGYLSEDGLTLLTVAYDRSARVWDLRSGMCAAVLAPGGQAQARPLPKA
jgi:WD40 repeat protein